MSDVAIRCEGLSKRYRIGERERYQTLRGAITHAAAAPFRILRNGARADEGSTSSDLWALDDVSFEVRRGDIVGIIGRNGAGKSTLLKTLSRITKPTLGHAQIHGRVGSLLEVGTGFHSELTGRENIYLNAAILGMRRAEVDRKFDEIVAFAEVEKFIDTPVKRYSSGMYVRLAFAVAAHLETEILLIDEVLAVGDAEFQKKCLGKLGDFSRTGRTVLFVSHNMQAIQSLCSSAFLIDGGRLICRDTPQSAVARYLSKLTSASSEIRWAEVDAPGNDEIRLLGIRVSSAQGVVSEYYSSNENIFVEMEFTAHTSHSALCVGYDLIAEDGVVIARSYQTDMAQEFWPRVLHGLNRWRCEIPKGLLNAGRYFISPRISMHNMYGIVDVDAVVQFEVVLSHGVSPFWNVLNSKNRAGYIAPIFAWTEHER